MTPPHTAIPVSYLYRFDQLLAKRHINTDDLMAEAGLGLSMATLKEDILELDLAQLEALFQLAIKRTGDNALGFYLGNGMPITTHGILGYAAMSGQNLRQSIQTIVRYLKTVNQLIRLTLIEENNTAMLQLDDNYHFTSCRKFFHDTFIGAINCMFNVVTNQDFRYSKIEFAYPAPQNIDSYETLFDCPVVFGRPATQVHFVAEQLDIPLVFADKNAHAMAARQCEQKLEALSQTEDLVSQIRLKLLEAKGHYPNADEIAQQLNITPRTLRRHLAKTAATYSDILGEVRQQHAIEYIQNKQLSIGEIAYMLGYSDPNNFGRAFKKWTNLTPAEYRSVHT